MKALVDWHCEKRRNFVDRALIIMLCLSMSDMYITCIGDGQDKDDDADKVAETVPGIGEVI